MKRMNRFVLLLFGLFFTQTVFSAPRELTLEAAIRMALENNPAIKAQQSQVEVADAKITQAQSFLVPHVNILSKYFYANNLPGMFVQQLNKVPVISSTGPVAGEYVPLRPMAPFPANNRDVLTMDLNVSYPIYTSGKIATANRNVKTLKSSYQKDRQQTEAQITLNVTTAFYNILFLKQVIRVNEDALAQLNGHLELAKKAYEEGVRSEFDILNFQSKVEEFKTRIVDLQGKLDVAETGLKNLLVFPLNEKVECKGTLQLPAQLLPENEKTLIKQVINQNFQMQSLRLKKRMVKNLEKINRADNRPTVFLFANYHVYHGMDFPPYDTAWRNGLAAGVGLSMNIFDGNLTHGKVEESRATFRRLSHFEEGLSLKLRFQVKKILEEINSLKAQLLSLKSNLKVAEKAYQIARVSYENGVITNIELNDAQLNVTRVKTLLLNVEKNLLLKKAEIDFLKGQKSSNY